jgi:hypothetical protein
MATNWSWSIPAAACDVIPHAHSVAIVEAELDGAGAWACRHGHKLEWTPERLELRLTLVQRTNGDSFYLQGQFTDYRALPPAWDFMDPSWGTGGLLANYPKLQSSRFGSSIFISHNNKGVICVPFNRLAYHCNGGPHGDWGDATAWLAAVGQGQHVRADHLGDMLQVILRDFSGSEGRMA